MNIYLLVGYIVLSLLTGLYGADRRLGFLGWLIIALVLNPLFVLPALFLTTRSKAIRAMEAQA